MLPPSLVLRDEVGEKVVDLHRVHLSLCTNGRGDLT